MKPETIATNSQGIRIEARKGTRGLDAMMVPPPGHGKAFAIYRAIPVTSPVWETLQKSPELAAKLALAGFRPVKG